MDYLAEMYGKRSPDFVHGFLAALDTYAIWKDGKQVIGCLDKSLKDIQKQAIEALAEHPEDFKHLISEEQNDTRASTTGKAGIASGRGKSRSAQ